MDDILKPHLYGVTSHLQCNGRATGKCPSVAGLILAAGASTRMGTSKQLLPFRGRTLLRHVGEVAVASELDPIVVVLGANAECCTGELVGLPVRHVENTFWQNGIGSSIRCGMRAMQPGIEAVVILLCDQPMIQPNLIRNFIAFHRANQRTIVASEYNGIRGVPALFPKAYFDELATLPDHHGAKRVINNAQHAAIRVPVPDAAFDIDTPTDFSNLLEQTIGETHS